MRAFDFQPQVESERTVGRSSMMPMVLFDSGTRRDAYDVVGGRLLTVPALALSVSRETGDRSGPRAIFRAANENCGPQTPR
jgi:hypothetical protein